MGIHNKEIQQILCTRDLYSFFIRVVCRASTSYDILAQTNFELSGQKCRSIEMVDKITFNLSIRVLFYTLVRNYEFDSGVLCYLHCGNPISAAAKRTGMWLTKLLFKEPKFRRSCVSVFLLNATKILCFSCS